MTATRMIEADASAMENKQKEQPSAAKKVARSTAWAAVDSWSQQGIQIVTFVVIGNIIGPEVYGIMAIGFIYMVVANAFIRDGFGEAVIQLKNAEREHFEAAFWVVVGLGLLAAGFSWLLAPYFAAWFDEPQLAMVIGLLGLTVPVIGAANLMQCKLRREMNFRALAFRSFVAYGGSAILAITLALMDYGIWSLLAFQICMPTLDYLCLAIQDRWLPRPRFSVSHYRDIAGFSYKSMGSHIITACGKQIDRTLVGLFLGATALGLYGMALRIFGGIQQTLMGVINNVALPAFSKVQDDTEELCRALKNATHFASLTAFPAFAGLALVSDWLISVLLKAEWQELGSILPILCLYGFTIPSGLFLTTAMRAVGRAGLVLNIATLTICLRLALCGGAIGFGFGFYGIVVATTAVPIILLPFRLYLAKRIIGLRVVDYCKSMIPAAAATSFMAACILAAESLVSGQAPAIVVLVALMVMGAASYVAALFLIARPSLNQIAAAVRR